MIASTTIAIMTPSTSPIGGSLSSAAADPPYSTWVAAPCAAASIASVWAVVTSISGDGELQVRVGDAAVLGDAAGVAEATSGTAASFLIAAPTAASSSVSPFAAAKTTRPVAPSTLDCGTAFWMSSIAAWDSVPGTLNSSLNVPLKAVARPASATRPISHVPSTSRRRRTAKYPSRCSNRAMCPFLSQWCVARQEYIVMHFCQGVHPCYRRQHPLP